MSDTARTDSNGETPAPDTDYGVVPGDVIGGRYEIIRLLGAGGMGAVFEARHKDIGKVVAIKLLRPALARDSMIAARFLQEARAATEVRHRNIVEILDYGTDERRTYIVMEYLRGEPLSSLMAREGALSPARVVAIFSPLLRALASAHERGVVHRDIKPENIFLVSEDDSDQPTPKILDFGIAKRAVGDDVRLTNTRSSFGTPAYMAPEQAMGAKDVTPAADQYAIGVILYEALSTRMPHTGDTYNAIIVAKVTREPISLAQVRPDLDPALVAVVMRTLSREPAARFPNLLALREALEPFRDQNVFPPSVPSLAPISAPLSR